MDEQKSTVILVHVDGSTTVFHNVTCVRTRPDDAHTATIYYVGEDFNSRREKVKVNDVAGVVWDNVPMPEKRKLHACCACEYFHNSMAQEPCNKCLETCNRFNHVYWEMKKCR